MKLAVYVTGHGYGHLTRTLEIVRCLKARHEDVQVHIRAPFPQAHILEALGFSPDSIANIQLDIGIVQRDSLRTNLNASIGRLEYYYGIEGDRLVEKEARWLEKAGIDAALLDIPPRAFDACSLAGVPAFGSTNFSWDWIWGDLAEVEPPFKRFAERAGESYRTCTRLFRTVMHSGLEAFPVAEDVPLISRISKRDPEETGKLLGISSDRIVVLLSYGGAGLNNVTLPPKELHKRYQFIATEPMPDPGDPFLYVPDKVVREFNLRYCDLVHASDIAMSKPGYSTVAECVGNKTAMIYSDRGRFAEYQVIADYIEKYLPSVLLRSEDLLSGRWEKALDTLADRMPFEFAETRTDGAQVVAERLHEEISV